MQKQAISAARDIGVAFGENQQPTNITWINAENKKTFKISKLQ